MAFPKPAVASAGLKKGAKSDQVKWIQEALNLTQGTKIGYTGNGYNYSGVFDDTLEKYVKDFQKKYGLTQDGIFGPASLKKMEELLKAEEAKKAEEARKLEEARKAAEAKMETWQTTCRKPLKDCIRKIAKGPMEFGMIKNTYDVQFKHDGVDIEHFRGSLPPPTAAAVAVYPALSGKVTKVVYIEPGKSGNKGYGSHIEIDHGKGYKTIYAHLVSPVLGTDGKPKSKVKVGDQVNQSTVIGDAGFEPDCALLGDYRNEVHFEIRLNGTPKNPADYIGKKFS